MHKPIRILLQTTIAAAEDDRHVGLFSLLRDHLTSLSDSAGRPLCEVTPRDRVVFHERGESRKNFSHAGGMKDSFDRQPPLPVSPPTRL